MTYDLRFRIETFEMFKNLEINIFEIQIIKIENTSNYVGHI